VKFKLNLRTTYLRESLSVDLIQIFDIFFRLFDQVHSTFTVYHMDKCFPLMKALAEICPEDFRKKTGLIDIFDQEIGQHLQQLDRILWWIFSEKTQFWILMKLEYVDFLNEWQLGIVSRFVDMETSNIAMKLSSNILLKFELNNLRIIEPTLESAMSISSEDSGPRCLFDFAQLVGVKSLKFCNLTTRYLFMCLYFGHA
jgi:hypothetical protein